jgi:hypothetical protein
MESIKDNIIYNIFEFLETGDLKYANNAKELINELATKYHIQLKKTQKANLKIIFKKFIINKDGYKDILPTFFNSI